MNISFILVEPAVPENVGAAARAIKTMGFTDFRLVNPCDYLNTKAKMLAHASHDILEDAKVYTSLAEAITDLDFIIATTAKQRWVKLDIIPSNKLLQFLLEKEDTISNIGIVFGREESGLTNEEISICSRVSTIPLASPYPSINLAQTVMIYAYTLSALFRDERNVKGEVNTQSLKSLQEKVSETLNIAGITPDMMIYGRIHERITELNAKDIRLLHSITTKLLDSINK
ncbi:MAG: tRNA/rRNA methyltransferase [Bacteroidales bacterium]|nr:MAG: tRNA/rRNA methyltransferase [Bacteroidales bacterium]